MIDRARSLHTLGLVRSVRRQCGRSYAAGNIEWRFCVGQCAQLEHPSVLLESIQPTMPPRPHKASRELFADVGEARRRNMSAISGRDTQPEIAVRRLAHRLGYRFRLHERNLPGRPDLVFPSRRKIIEVRGCFWHRHPGCGLAATPKTRLGFWQAKFDATVKRDARNIATLSAKGWQVMVIWECEVNDALLPNRLTAFLGKRGHRQAT
jgi:DNA mismatch endonuclease, patch repair protein